MLRLLLLNLRQIASFGVILTIIYLFWIGTLSFSDIGTKYQNNISLPVKSLEMNERINSTVERSFKGVYQRRISRYLCAIVLWNNSYPICFTPNLMRNISIWIVYYSSGHMHQICYCDRKRNNIKHINKKYTPKLLCRQHYQHRCSGNWQNI